MLPSIDLRLQNLIKAMREVIVPALPERETLARDQAMLVMAHLQLISQQWRSVPKFEAGSLDELGTLVSDILTAAAADIPDELRAQAQTTLTGARSTDRQNHEAVVQTLLQLGQAADRLIESGSHATPMSPALKQAVLRYGARQSLRDRAWFAGHHLDPAPGEVPAFESVIMS